MGETIRYTGGRLKPMKNRALLSLLVSQRDASYPVRVSFPGDGKRVLGWAQHEDAERYCRDRAVRFHTHGPLVAGSYAFEYIDG